jgi:hypothetical protein
MMGWCMMVAEGRAPCCTTAWVGRCDLKLKREKASGKDQKPPYENDANLSGAATTTHMK